MEPLVEFEVPDVVPDDDPGPFIVRGVARFHEELVRAGGYRDRLLAEGRARGWSLDQDAAQVREWFAERGLNLRDPVVASSAIITLSVLRGRSPGLRGQVAAAAIESIDRLHDDDTVPPTDRQLRLFE